MTPVDLKQYQWDAMVHTMRRPAALLQMPMGSGKTVTVLTLLNQLLRRQESKGALVIAPLRVIQLVWRQEAAGWEHLRGLRFQLVHGTPLQRRRALTARSDIWLVNYENLVWLQETLSPYPSQWPFDVLVWDELSKMKHYKTNRWKAARRLIFGFRRRIGLTGTPMGSGYEGLWAMLMMLDGGDCLGKSLHRFRSRYCDSIQHASWREYILKPGAEGQIQQRVAPLVYQPPVDPREGLPELIRSFVKVELELEEWMAYERIHQLLKLPEALRKASSPDWIAHPENAMVLYGKLAQLASGNVYLDEETVSVPRKRVLRVHRQKLLALQEIIGEANGRPVLVLYTYQHELESIQKKYPEACALTRGEDPELLVEEWNAGRVPILLGHPASMGHGLNLQYGGYILVWVSLPWSRELYDQTIARVWRTGQAHPTYVYHLIAQGTVDEEIMCSLQDKGAQHDTFIDAIKRYLLLNVRQHPPKTTQQAPTDMEQADD